jgi:lipopolysaccharide assembly outer membrane protein LptD (OstA)
MFRKIISNLWRFTTKNHFISKVLRGKKNIYLKKILYSKAKLIIQKLYFTIDSKKLNIFCVSLGWKMEKNLDLIEGEVELC